MDDHREHWEKIIVIHRNLKQIILYGEELGGEFDTFLQPSLEQKHALEHIMRAQSVVLGFDERDDGEGYVKSQLDKSIGHLYRSFFDAADWLSLIIREKITKDLKGYSAECIEATVPSYYSEIKPALLDVSKKIADIRRGKDVEKHNSEMINEVEKYNDVLDYLIKSHEEIVRRIPSLQEYKKRQRSSKTNSFLINIALVVISVVATALVTTWLKN